MNSLEQRLLRLEREVGALQPGHDRGFPESRQRERAPRLGFAGMPRGQRANGGVLPRRVVLPLVLLCSIRFLLLWSR